MDEVFALQNTPHLFFLDEDGAVHMASDPKALTGIDVDWFTRKDVTLDQLRQYQRGEPILSLALVKIGDAIYLPQAPFGGGAPKLRLVKSIADLSAVGIGGGELRPAGAGAGGLGGPLRAAHRRPADGGLLARRRPRGGPGHAPGADPARGRLGLTPSPARQPRRQDIQPLGTRWLLAGPAPNGGGGGGSGAGGWPWGRPPPPPFPPPPGAGRGSSSPHNNRCQHRRRRPSPSGAAPFAVSVWSCAPPFGDGLGVAPTPAGAGSASRSRTRTEKRRRRPRPALASSASCWATQRASAPAPWVGAALGLSLAGVVLLARLPRPREAP